MRIAAASDIHGKYKLKWPVADVLVLAGDILPNWSSSPPRDAELQRIYLQSTFAPLLTALSASYKDVVLIPGNHDRVWEKYEEDGRNILCDISNLHILIDQGATIQNKLFWGSPWTPWFHGEYWAFNIPQFYGAAEQIWNKIPLDTDVLVTHGPPYGILDATQDGRQVGCKALLNRLREIKPAAHIFGHIHEGYGASNYNGTLCVNASICTLQYDPINPIKVIELPD